MNEIITAETKQELTTESVDIVTRGNALTIINEQENAAATIILSAIKKMRTKVEDKFNPAVKAAKSAYDEARNLRDEFLSPLKSCEESLRQKIGAFVTAENTRREALQAKADAKYDKAVEKSEATGKPITVAPVIVAQVKATAGASFSVSWYAEVTDLVALCRAIGEGKADANCVMANGPFLNGLAKAYKQEKEIVAGVVAKKKTITRV